MSKRARIALFLVGVGAFGAGSFFLRNAALTREAAGPMTRAQRLRADLGAVPEDGLSQEVAIEDPSGHVLQTLHQSLARAASGHGRARLVFFGGSHTAGDEYTGVVREHLQRHYGNGGHGFVLPVPTYTDFKQSGITIDSARGFASIRPDTDRRNVDFYGMAGIRFDTGSRSRRDAPAGIASLETHNAPFDRIRFWYLRGPRLGSFSFGVDDDFTRAETRASTYGFGETVRAVGRNDHSVEIRASANAKLFGVVLERGDHGVIVDNVAVTGSKARHHLFWEETLWRTMAEALAPDFIVLAYGNNEAEDTHLSFAEHRAQYAAMLSRVRTALPDAGCLVIGPGYRYLSHDGQNVFADFTVQMNTAQRELAFEYGCAFFDTQQFQGHPESLERWRSVFPSAWLREDGVHWNPAAYRRFGEVLLRALLRDV